MIYGLDDERTHPPLCFADLEDFRRLVVEPWDPADPRMAALGAQARVQIGPRLWSWATFVNVPHLGRLCCPAFHDDIDIVDLSRGGPSPEIAPWYTHNTVDSVTKRSVQLPINNLYWSLSHVIHLWAIVSARDRKLYCPECNAAWSLRAVLRLQAKRRRLESLRRNVR